MWRILVGQVMKNQNLLILGRPGAGKSVAIYELAKALPNSHFVFPYRLSALRRTYAQWKAMEVHLSAAKRAGAQCVFLLDGLDEASVTEGHSAFDIRAVLGELAALGTVVVSCRTVDFEQYLAGYVTESVDFSSIWQLEPWRHDVEFTRFIEILRERRSLMSWNFWD